MIFWWEGEEEFLLYIVLVFDLLIGTYFSYTVGGDGSGFWKLKL